MTRSQRACAKMQVKLDSSFHWPHPVGLKGAWCDHIFQFVELDVERHGES